MDIKVSLIASAVRSKFFPTFLESLKDTTEQIEVVFAGTCTKENLEAVGLSKRKEEGNILFKYIKTNDIKPAQCYEVARRIARGETIHWTADDCEYKDDCIGKAYRAWKTLNNRKTVLSIQSKENGVMCDMNLHSFFGYNPQTPRMAPLGLMDRLYLDELGGIDQRYICGQYENDIVMRVYADGGNVVQFNESYVEIDHRNKHGIMNNRPFAIGYPHDRKILEDSWTKGNHVVVMERKDKFEPYKEENLLIKSQSFKKSCWV